MTRSDPQALPWADRVGYAENSTKLRIGEGSWVTIKGRFALLMSKVTRSGVLRPARLRPATLISL